MVSELALPAQDQICSAARLALRLMCDAIPSAFLTMRSYRQSRAVARNFMQSPQPPTPNTPEITKIHPSYAKYRMIDPEILLKYDLNQMLPYIATGLHLYIPDSIHDRTKDPPAKTADL